MHHDAPPPQQLFAMITAFWTSQAVGTFAELGLADHLAAGAQPARDLASRAGTDPDATFRLLRGLASAGVVTQDGARFELTPLGQLLRADVPGSLREMARAMTLPGHWQPWGRLRDAVRTGTRQTAAALGAELFGYYAEHTDERASFFGAMRGLTNLVAAEAPKVYDASAHLTVCDVGGSSGALVASFLRANPNLRGSVLERADVVPMTTAALAEVGLAGRCEAIAGDFFLDVPEADLYLLKHILHDWNDEQCRTILGHCARRMRPGGKVVLVEMVIPEDRTPSVAPMMDLNMLVLMPGRERTAGQYGELFAAAGLRLVDVRPTHSPMQLVVAERA